MSLEEFKALSAQLSALAGCAPAAVRMDRQRQPVFSLRMRGVLVAVAAARNPDELVLVAELGMLPRALARPGWMALLEANAHLLGDSPRFSRNPHTGEAVVQWLCARPRVPAAEIHQRMQQLVALAQHWRVDHFLDSRQRLPPLLLQPRHALPDLQARARFHALCLAIGEKLGQRLAPAPSQAPVTRLAIRLGDTEVSLAHSARERPGLATIIVHLGRPLAGASAAQLAALCEANFALAAQSPGSAFCRHPLHDELLLHYACVLEGASAEHCVAQMDAAIALARPWKDGVPEQGQDAR